MNLLLSLFVTVCLLGAAEILARHFEHPEPKAQQHSAPIWEQQWQGNFYVVKSHSAGWNEVDMKALRAPACPTLALTVDWTTATTAITSETLALAVVTPSLAVRVMA